MIATLFDFNGVLVDDEHVHLDAFRDVLRPRGIVIAEAAYVERYLGFDDVGALRAMIADAGQSATEAEIHELVEAKKPAYMARVKQSLKIVPGAAEIVIRRSMRGPVGVVSGALAHEIRFALDRMQVRARVSFIVSAEDTAASKPDPMGYRLAASRAARLGATRAVVVEDSLSGVEAAKAAGLRCVAVASTYPGSRLRAAGADAVVSTLLALDDETLEGKT